MRDRDDGPRKVGEEALEPRDALGVQMVGRLVEEQHVRLLEQHLAERDAPFLAARKLRDVGVGRREPQRVHGDLHLAVELPEVVGVDVLLELALLLEQRVHRVVAHRLRELHRDFVEAVELGALLLHRFVDVAFHVFLGIEDGFLRQEPDARALVRPRLALKLMVDARHDAEQR